MRKLDKHLIIIHFVINSFLFSTSCHKQKAIDINVSPAKSIKIANLFKTSPVDLDSLIENVRFVVLENNNKISFHVDRLIVNDRFIYINDYRKKMIFIYDHRGAFYGLIKGVDAFEFFKNKLYTYNINAGILKCYSQLGKLISQSTVGFRGLDFVSLNDSTLVFQTGGLKTQDNESTKYELAYVSRTGKFQKFALPITKPMQGINYNAKQRFSENLGDGHLFISSLGNIVYKLHDNSIEKILQFDFYSATLRDSIFEGFKQIEDYNFFPFAINLTNRINVPSYSFFNFSVKGDQGYIIVSRPQNRAIVVGFSNVTGINSAFNTTIPQAYYKDEYVSVTDAKEFLENYFFVENISQRMKKKLFKMKQEILKRNKNPVLMFYKLKPFNSHIDTTKVGLH